MEKKKKSLLHWHLWQMTQISEQSWIIWVGWSLWKCGDRSNSFDIIPTPGICYSSQYKRSEGPAARSRGSDAPQRVDQMIMNIRITTSEIILVGEFYAVSNTAWVPKRGRRTKFSGLQLFKGAQRAPLLLVSNVVPSVYFYIIIWRRFDCNYL